MKQVKFKNNHIYYLNNIGTKNIVSLKRKPRNNEGSNFGELVQKKTNYILYASGNQKSNYELYPKETQFKSSKSKDRNISNILNKRINIIKYKPIIYDQSFHNKSFISCPNNNNHINHIIQDSFKPEHILQSSINYGYKETKNVKHFNPNLNVITIHDDQKQDIYPQREAHTVNIIKDRNIKIYKRDFNNYSEKNQGIRIIQESKSQDNILRRKAHYRIQINNEAIPCNHKSKVIKITKKQNGDIKEIYQRKYVKNNKSDNNLNKINNLSNNNISHCYTNNLGEKSFDSIEYFRNSENYYYNNDNIYNYNSGKNNRNKYFINNNYESNGYNLKNKFGYNKEIFGDEESKNIECPIHGNIAIVVHKKMNKIN